MSGVVGIEIGAERVRAVVRSRSGRLRTFELPFVPERLDEMVTQLSTAAGDVRGIGLAIGLAHLHVKQVKLPPVAHPARRQMLSVEPERWFAVSEIPHNLLNKPMRDQLDRVVTAELLRETRR